MIYDIYIARKRDKTGNRFGFISMLDVKDKEDTCKKLSAIRMGEYRLRFNVARFVMEEGEIGVERKDNGGNVREKGKDFERKGIAGDHGSGKMNAWNAGGRSFKDTLMGEKKDNSEVRSISIDSKVRAFESLHGKAVIVRMDDLEALRKLKITMKEIGMLEGRVQYLGGVSALISYEDCTSAIGALEVGKLAGKKFSHISLWEGQSFGFERLAWLKVHGIPLHILSNGVIDSVGGLFGKIVHKAERSELDKDLSFEFVGVLVGEGRRVADEVVVKWGDRKYRVWVLEEMGDWVPEFDDPGNVDGDMNVDGRVVSEVGSEEVTGEATEVHRNKDFAFNAGGGYISPVFNELNRGGFNEEEMQEGGFKNSNVMTNKFSTDAILKKKKKKI